jgi:hypothetical protein
VSKKKKYFIFIYVLICHQLIILFCFSSRQSMYDFLEVWLRHKSDIVSFEAAKAICNIKDVTSKELYQAVNGKGIFISL